MKICIIGAGASGLAAAITAARINESASITILEKKEKPAAKLLATGNGRCNITNASCQDLAMTSEFLSSVGIVTRVEDEGRMYPVSGRAQDVYTALLSAAEAEGISIITSKVVTQITSAGSQGSAFSVVCEDGSSYDADRVLIASGGKAAPQFGTSGDSYTLARALGHTVTKLAPVLTPLDIKGFNGQLKGIRAHAKVTLLKRNQPVHIEIGEVQFTEKGISGVCIFNISRHVILDADTHFGDYQVEIDFLPDFGGGVDTVKEILRQRQTQKGIVAGELLRTLVDERIAKYIMTSAGVDNTDAPVSKITEIQLDKIASLIKGWPLTVSGAGGWNVAQCTRGGVTLEEIDPATMESQVVPGLYLAGEAIDYDGPCGGFNLQNAWVTGILAGQAMGRE